MEHLKTPAVGMGITVAINGDSYPYTIQSVSESGHQFYATRDRFIGAKNVDQSYSEGDKTGLFIPDPEGASRKFTRKCGGRYGVAGSSCYFVYEGRSYAQDPSL